MLVRLFSSQQVFYPWGMEMPLSLFDLTTLTAIGLAKALSLHERLTIKC